MSETWAEQASKTAGDEKAVAGTAVSGRQINYPCANGIPPCTGDCGYNPDDPTDPCTPLAAVPDDRTPTQGDRPMSDDLLDALESAERDAAKFRGLAPCQACAAIDSESDPERKTALTRALGGTIGVGKLVPILHKQGIEVGKRHLVRHRQQEHGV